MATHAESDYVNLPDHLCLEIVEGDEKNCQDGAINFVLGSIGYQSALQGWPEYAAKRAILASTNNAVKQINNECLRQLPGDCIVAQSIGPTVEPDRQLSCGAVTPQHQKTRLARPAGLGARDGRANAPDSAAPQGLDRLGDRYGHKNDFGHQGMLKAPFGPQYGWPDRQGFQIEAEVSLAELQSKPVNHWKSCFLLVMLESYPDLHSLLL